MLHRIALVVSLFAGPALAGPQTWDVATFDAPTWPVEKSNDTIGFTEINQAAGTFCRLSVLTSRPSSGDARADFKAEWTEIVDPAVPSPTPGKTSGGLAYLEAGAMVTRGEAQYFYQLLTFTQSGRRLSVLINGTTPQAVTACRPRLAPFFASFRVKGGAPAQPAAPDVGCFHGGGLAGVWMGFRQESLLAHTPQLNWVVTFDDGQFFQNLPGEGLLGFDRAASRAQLAASWGTWSWDGSAGLIKKPGVDARYDLKLAAGKNGQVLFDGQPYFRCARVDGLRLQGAWTSFANPDDPALDGPATHPRSLIHFTKDGRFVDDGVFATFLHDGQDDPGSGTYAIKDYTLTLNFSDGRVKRLAFTGSLSVDPSKDDSTLYLKRSAFSKRR